MLERLAAITNQLAELHDQHGLDAVVEDCLWRAMQQLVAAQHHIIEQQEAKRDWGTITVVASAPDSLEFTVE